MIGENELPIRGFYWSNKAWYAEGAGIKRPEVNFGLYYRHDGTTGEMSMNWEELGGKLVPYLRVYCDAWKALANFKDVIDALGRVDNKSITDIDFIKILLDSGFTDLTAYEYTEKAGK